MIKSILYKNGHRLAYTDYGDPDDFPVLVQHGLIASIRESQLFQALVKGGRRVISTARPGYGESSPYAMQNVAEWGEITSLLAKELGLARFDVLGISSGAPYSYAIGAKLGEQVRNLFILSGTPALYAESVQARWRFPLDLNASLDSMQQTAREVFFNHLSAEALENPAVQDSVRNECFGPGLDLQIRPRDWGFRLNQVRSRVYMRHSRADEAVPLVTAKLTASLLPDCQLDIRENETHFSQVVLDDFIRTSVLCG